MRMAIEPLFIVVMGRQHRQVAEAGRPILCSVRGGPGRARLRFLGRGVLTILVR